MKDNKERILFVGGPLDGERKWVSLVDEVLPTNISTDYVELEESDDTTNPLDNVREGEEDVVTPMEYHLCIFDSYKNKAELPKMYLHRGVNQNDVLGLLIKGYQVSSQSDEMHVERRLRYVNRQIRRMDKHRHDMKDRKEIVAYRNDLLFFRSEPAICNCEHDLISMKFAINAADSIIAALNWIMGSNYDYDKSVERLAQIVRRKREEKDDE